MGLDFTIGHKKTPATYQSFNNYILQSKDATGLHYYLNNKKGSHRVASPVQSENLHLFLY